MRTTLTIDDDVLHAVQERARRERRTSGQVLSALAREALTRHARAHEAAGGSRHGFRPLPHRGGLVTNQLVDRLRRDDPE